jgi:hypothetical protein
MDTGLTNLPLHDFASNEIWCALVALAGDLVAWMQTLALTRTPPAGGNPSACACGCSPSPDASRPPADAPACTSPDRRRSPAWPSTASAGSTPWPPPAEHGGTVPTTAQHPGPWNPATTPTTRGHLSHPECRITDHGGQEPAVRLTRPSHARSGLGLLLAGIWTDSTLPRKSFSG